VNVGVAAGARRQLIRSRAHSADRVVGDPAVALVAERVDRRHIQQSRVLRTVRSVAPRAAFRLHRSVLVHKGPARLRVAFRADPILIGGGLQVVRLEGAVRIVAIAAAHRAFIHRMMERHFESGLLIAVALEAELGLFGHQQVLIRLGVMDAVTAGAANIGLRMGGALKIRVRAGVAAKAGLVDLLHAQLVEAANLRDIASAFDVGLAGAVATLAGHTLAGMFEGEMRVGIRAKLLHDIRVTIGACVLADEIRRIHCRLRLGSCRWLLATAGSERQPGSCEPGQ